MRRPTIRRSRVIAALLTLGGSTGILVSQLAYAPASHASDRPGAADGLGQLSGLLPRDHLTEESAIQVDLSNETVRLPLYKGIAYKGTPQQETVGDVLLDASDAGLARDL